MVLPVLALGLVLAGCDAGGVPTATPTAIGQATLEVPTAQATNTAEAQAPTETTEPAGTPIEPVFTPTEVAAQTPAPQPGVGDLQWKQVGLAGKVVQDLALLPTGLNLVLAAGPEGQWRSSYDYTNWEALQGITGGRTSSVAIGSPDVMYATSHTGCASGAEIKAARSADGGNSWQPLSIPSQPIRIAAAGATTAYGIACTGVIKSSDGGGTWSELPGASIENLDPFALAASPDGQTVFVAHVSEGGSAKVNRSTDGGATWTDVTPQGQELRAPILLFLVTGSVGRPDDAGVYMASSPGMLWFLTDGGGPTDWTVSQGADPRLDIQPKEFQISALYVDTAYTETKAAPVIYTARTEQAEDGTLKGLGVFRSTDAGTTWEQVGQGLTDKAVNSLAFGAANSMVAAQITETLLAGTDDGVWAAPMR